MRQYSNDDMLFAIELMSRSRSAYSYLTDYITLPSFRLLRSVTSGINTVSDSDYIEGIVGSLKENQRKCIIEMDEVYLRDEIDYVRFLVLIVKEEKRVHYSLF